MEIASICYSYIMSDEYNLSPCHRLFMFDKTEQEHETFHDIAALNLSNLDNSAEQTKITMKLDENNQKTSKSFIQKETTINNNNVTSKLRKVGEIIDLLV